jgi:hypothetical protein
VDVALEGHRLERLWIFSQAALQRKLRPAFDPRDLEDFTAVWTDPSSPTTGTRAGRAERLRGALTELQQAEGAEGARLQLHYGLTLFLEAVRPSREQLLSFKDIDDLLGLIDLRHPALREVLHGLLKLGSLGSSPIDRVRQALGDQPGDSIEHAQEDLLHKRKELHAEVKRLWSAAGGKVQRTHCRRAWDEFIEQATPTLRLLYPIEEGGQRQEWNPEPLRTELGQLLERYIRIADKRGAKYQDRRTMDRAARRIIDLATAVNEAMLRLLAAREARGEAGAELIPVQDTRSLLEGPALDRPEEELYRRCLLRLLRPVSNNGAGPAHDHPEDLLALVPARHLCDYPDLLSVLPLGPVQRLPDAAGLAGMVVVPDPFAGVRLDSITDPLRAAAILISSEARPVNRGQGGESFLETLVQTLKQRTRFDLLGRLTPVLPTTDQEGIYKQRAAALDRLYTTLTILQRVWRDLDDLAAAEANSLKTVIREAEHLAAEQAPGTAEPVMVRTWLQQVLEVVGKIRDARAEMLRRQLLSLGDEGAERLRALEQGHLAEAVTSSVVSSQLSVVSESGSSRTSGERSRRETLWRRRAVDLFRHPNDVLGRLRATVPLVQEWQTPGRGYRTLKTTFAKMIFDNPSGQGTLYRKGDNNRADRFVLHCEEIINYLAHQGLNPCYLPQLRSFQHLVLLTPPVPPTDRSFVQRVAGLVAGDRDLHIVLAPGLTPETRERTLKELRKRGASAAVLDDIDLCRLLNPGGRQIHLVLGLFEIALEQQRWIARSPFQAPEGMQVRMEMYVGRRDEARRLSRESTFSRVFSGRKLGKTALLRFIAEREDETQLPSGLQLRVLYVPIVGVQSETDLVNKVVRAVRDRLGFDPPRGPDATTPDLVDFLDRFIEAHPRDSLLIVLDEADEFVLSQLEEYERRGNTVLSFKMRSGVQARMDKMGLPRVRFVFAGYRATQRSEGAWFNWGDVLRLNPLGPEEAADLIAGPLARLGIDATQQAPAIAFRCGYQPAVLLRFGEELLGRLEQTGGYREGAEVSADDVAETFNHKSVQDEIYNVLRNNFDRNPLGRAVFAALVLEFAGLPPGQGLERAPERVLDRLGLVEPDTAWLRREDSSAKSQIAYQLNDFVKRQLLTETVIEGETVYRLKFPYHLPVLLANNPEEEIRLAIAEIRREDENGKQPQVRALLSPRALEDLRLLTRQPPEEGLCFRAALVASHWPEAVNHNSGGVAVRLGFDPGETLRVAEVGPDSALRPCLTVYDAAPANVQEFLERRPGGLPAVLFTGGADLLRWALYRMYQSDEVFEIGTLGRIGANVLRWWFQRVRCLEFPNSPDLDDLYRRSGGLPILLRALDRLLVPPGSGEGGINVTRDQVDHARSAFDGFYREAAQALVRGSDAERLHERELDVLRMLDTAASVSGAEGLAAPRSALTEEWELLYAEHWPIRYPGKPVPARLSEAWSDRVAVEMVQLLGLVPFDPDAGEPLVRLRRIGADDALLRILAVLRETP